MLCCPHYHPLKPLRHSLANTWTIVRNQRLPEVEGIFIDICSLPLSSIHLPLLATVYIFVWRSLGPPRCSTRLDSHTTSLRHAAGDPGQANHHSATSSTDCFRDGCITQSQPMENNQIFFFKVGKVFHFLSSVWRGESITLEATAAIFPQRGYWE